jgi:hypothetical protein
MTLRLACSWDMDAIILTACAHAACCGHWNGWQRTRETNAHVWDGTLKGSKNNKHSQSETNFFIFPKATITICRTTNPCDDDIPDCWVRLPSMLLFDVNEKYIVNRIRLLGTNGQLCLFSERAR